MGRAGRGAEDRKRDQSPVIPRLCGGSHANARLLLLLMLLVVMPVMDPILRKAAAMASCLCVFVCGWDGEGRGEGVSIIASRDTFAAASALDAKAEGWQA